MSWFFFLMIFSVLVGVWSNKRGTGFAWGFVWSFFLSPIVGAIAVLLRTPRSTPIVQGGIAVEEARTPEMARPNVVAVGIIVGFCLIMSWAAFYR